jgi:hypothetical protein
LLPDQQHPPLPHLLFCTTCSPVKHSPAQNGAVPRQVSAFAIGIWNGIPNINKAVNTRVTSVLTNLVLFTFGQFKLALKILMHFLQL